MMQILPIPFRRAVLACCLAGVALSGARLAHAGITGSVHDFSSKPIAADGPCSACHRSHKSEPSLLWSRSLVAERNYFTQDSSMDPDYVPGTTLLCYDCHDDNPLTVSPAVDADPLKSIWSISREPQNIAFTDDTLSQGGTKTGFYELVNGDVPGGPTPLPPAGDPTGGHYWKSEPSGTPDYQRGDKIPCSLCHDPHNARTGSPQNEAFFLSSTSFAGGSSVALGNGLKASDKNDAANPNRSRNGTGTGREMCSACHSYSNSGSPVTLGGVTLPKPPAIISQHGSSNSTPCVVCHPHNQVFTSCSWCHGFPPLKTIAEAGAAFDKTLRPDAENYSGGAGAHQRHKDALGDAIFKCEICHGPNPGSAAWHNTGGGVIANGANVNIMGLDTYWSPAGYPGGTSPMYTGGAAGPAPGDTAYLFSRMGGGQQRCSGVACHGNPLIGETTQLNWTDDMIDGDVPDPVAAGEIQICKWCHDATPATIDGGATYAPNVLGNGLATAAGFGAEVNGHGVGLAGAVKAVYDKDAVNDAAGAAGAAKECTVCHDATYVAAPPPNHARRTHFGAGTDPRDEKRLHDTINGAAMGTSTTFPTAPDQACSACHQNGVNTAVDGFEQSHHSNTAGGYTPPLEGPFTRACRQCHNVHGANWNGTGRNLYMVGKWLDVNDDKVANAADGAFVDSNATTTLAATTPGGGPANDNAVVFTATTGANSFDENDGAYDSTGVADRDDICATCHVPATGSGAGTGGGSHAGSTNGIGEFRGQNCTVCHDHDYDGDPTAPIALTADAFMPSGCSGCHGRSTADGVDTQGDPALKNQYWPDGTPPTGQPYCDDDPGAHYRHVQALALQLYGETPAQVVTDTAFTSFTKQKAICAFCHPNPGGGGHNADLADPLNLRVTVYLDADDTAGVPVDVFRKLTVGAGASGQDRSGANGDQAYNFVNQNCSNLVCHNQAATPVAPAGWNVPPNWAPGANADCSNTTCHAAGTYTNMHPVHVENLQKNYACTECHANNFAPVNLAHGNGEVDMVFNVTAGIAPTPIEASVGTGNGFYDKDGSGGVAPSAGDTAFAYKSGIYNVTCNLVYCHGGDNAAWGGGDTTPVWDNSAPDSVYCGSCHDGNGTIAPAGDASVAATGNHTDHLTAAHGPRFADPTGPAGPGATVAASCLGTATIGCHTDFQLTTATHVNGSAEFRNIALTAAALAATDRCNGCHSTATVTVNIPGPTTVTGTGVGFAKTNWGTGAYTLPCLTCHNGTDPATVFANGTGVVNAPDMLGDDTNYGAEVRGHSRALADGNYPVSLNVAAAKDCIACHDAASIHITNVADATYAGNRMITAVNGINGLTATSATMACNNCHAVSTGTPAVKHFVNMHGNTNYAGRLEGLFPAASGAAAIECMNCHEPHGRTANGTGYNIYMVPSTITVPGAAAGVTAPGVRFEAKTGNFSFNDTQGTDADDLCVVCHGLNGNSMQHNDGGDHAAPGYGNDELGSDCTGCHMHNRDTPNVVTVDGFMTVACNTCHTFDESLPGNGAPLPHRLSASHDIHVGRPSNEPAIPNKGFVCNACHYKSAHNNALPPMKPGDTWPAGDVQVRFADPNAVPPLPVAAGPWNTVAAANNPVDRTQDSTSYNDTTNVCSNLYCHGADAPFPAADAGSNITPDWDLAATADCGTCHRRTAAIPPGSLAHPTHAGNAAGQYAIGCQVCHYTTTADGTTIVNMIPHVNHSADVAFSALADLRVDGASTYNNLGDSGVGAPYFDCSATYCHSNGTDRGAPYDSASAGSAAPGDALAWDLSGSCWSCHGDGAALSRPDYADGSPKANKHPIHTGTDPDPLTSRDTNAYGCQVCHWPTTQTGNTVFSTAIHVNRSYEANDDGAGSTLDAFDSVTNSGTCDSANCHGGNSGISWGLAGPITCDICHAESGGSPVAGDANNFAWDGTIQSKVAAAEYTAVGHGGQSVACAGCHDNDVGTGFGHDVTMAGANPYRLRSFAGNQIAFCNTACHAVQVRTHDPDEMQAAGIAPKRIPWPAPWNTPATSPRCVNCHDPHGDGANLAMVQKELYDKAPFQVNAAAPAAPTEQTNLLFTNNATAPFVDTTAPYESYADDGTFSSICQECHEATGGATGMVSFHDGTTAFGANHPSVGTTDCSDCHRHDAGFAPSGCEGCHNIDTTYPLAPNVMGPGNDPDGTGTTPKPYDNGTWGYNVNGHGANGTATNTPKEEISPGVFVPYLTPNVPCTGCHDISLPSSGAGRHLNGILNSVDTKVNPSENTAHLRTDGAYPFIIGSGGNAWDVQVAFDLACYMRCHQPGGVSNHRHSQDLILAPAEGHETNFNNVFNAVRFGDKGTVANGESVSYPIDTALTINANTAADDFAPCISCHNPHGTSVVETTTNTNRMVRDQFSDGNTLCLVCHQ